LKHFLYGLDVDLIMLGLGSKKIHFTLLRKKLIENEKTQGKSLLMGSGEKKWHGLG
jgi:5'-3' exonuclease